jgi:uncharacterized protein (DUF433 family)
MTTIQGVIHGKTIELEKEPGIPDGQAVSVDIRPIMGKTPSEEIPSPPWWLERLVVDSTVRPGKFVIKGTRLLVDDLVQDVEKGRSDDELRQLHPELAIADLEAVRLYARVPEGLRESFGAWHEDAEELDKYLKWTRKQRKLRRREIEG